MSVFKLLAIRPLEGCDSKFLKVLKEGRIYRFYNDYTFYDTSNKEQDFEGDVAKIELNSKIPNDLYNINDVNLNISAVVGKNGSGKSSLIELLYVANFLLAIELKILKSHDKKDTQGQDGIDEIKRKNSVRLDKLQLQKELARDIVKPDFGDDYIKEIAKKLNTISWLNKEQERLDSLRNEIHSLRKQVKVEVFYQIEDNIFMLKIDSKKKEPIRIGIIPFESSVDNNGVEENREQQRKVFVRNEKINKLLKDETTDLSSHFFYSLVLNYSQYALNSKEIGNWITELFHKNDGYQTPIVINPMRTEGNFDINRENDLVKQRLLVNVFTPLKKNEKVENSLRHLAQNHIAHRVKITINKDKFKNERGDEELKVLTDYTEEWKIIEDKLLKNKRATKTDWDDYAKDYIITKLISMEEKYPPYSGNCVDKRFTNLDGYLDDLMKDDSHIAYKFHQAINFLKYDYATLYIDAQKSKGINDLAKELNRVSKEKKEELKHLIPPSFLTIDILFDEKEPKNENVEETNTLQNLSSGEKQYIYSISSIMYHLRYLDSVKERKEEKDNEEAKNKLKYKYRYVNLVFDEIELYYHPELQRQFIYDFRNAIDRCKLESIKNINCTFVTHSPFILSDIPKSNILMLENGEEEIEREGEKVKTFAANIHELLGESFFLDNGYVGEFVKMKIEQLLEFYKKTKAKKKLPETNSFTKEKALEFIALIDDDLIADRLREIHQETFQEKEKELQSEEYEQWLKSELARIKLEEE